MNTRLPQGSALPAAAPPPGLWAELDRGGTRVCNLARGVVEPRIVCVDLPVVRDGRAAFMLSVVMSPDQVGRAIRSQHLPPGSFTTIIDRQGTVIWRDTAADRFIGKPAPAHIRRALAQSREGVRESQLLEGVPTVAAFSRSSYSGWTFVVAVPRAEMHAGGYRALTLALVGAAFLLLLRGLVGTMVARRMVARRVNRAVNTLAATAEQVRLGAVVRLRADGLCRDRQRGAHSPGEPAPAERQRGAVPAHLRAGE